MGARFTKGEVSLSFIESKRHSIIQEGCDEVDFTQVTTLHD